MPKVTFEVTPELKELMDEHPEVNWSAIFRQAIERQVHAAEIAQQVLQEMGDPRVHAVAATLTRGVADRWERARHARRR